MPLASPLVALSASGLSSLNCALAFNVQLSNDLALHTLILFSVSLSSLLRADSGPCFGK